MPELIYNVKFKIDNSSAQSMKGVIDKNAAKEVEDLKKVVQELQQKLVQTSNSTKDVDQQTQDFISTTKNQTSLVKSLNSEMAKTIRVYGENSKEAKELNEELVREKQLLDNTIFTLDQYAQNTELSTDAQTALYNTIASGNTTIVQAGARLKEYNRAVKSTGGEVGQMNTQFSAGNQAIFSFSDMVQDSAQFQFGFAQGMRAIGNNVGYTAELLAVMTKNARDNGMTFAQAMKGSLTGINAFIVGLNVAVTAVTMLGKSIGGTSKEATDSVNEFVDASVALKDAGDFDFLDIQKTRDQIAEFEDFKEKIANNDEQIESLKEYIKVVDRFGVTTFKQTEASKRAVKEFEKTLGVFGKTTVKEVQEQIDELNETLRDNEQLARENEFAQYKQDIDSATNKVLLFTEAGLDAGMSLQDLSNELGQELEMTKSLMSTNDDYIAQYKFIKKQYELVENAIQAKTKEQEKEAKAIKEIADKEYKAQLEIKEGYEERRKMVESTNEALTKLRDAEHEKLFAESHKKATEKILDSHAERMAFAEKEGLAHHRYYTEIVQGEHNRVLQTLSVNGKLKAVYEERMALMKQEQDMAKETLAVVGKFTVTDELVTPMRGSIAFLEKEIAGLEAGFVNVTTDAARESLANVIKAKQEELDGKRALMDQETAVTEFNHKKMAKSAKFISDGLFENEKASAVAGAIMNTYKAATEALASAPPPFGAILMGGVIASGMAQVKKIMTTKKDGSGAGGSTQSTSRGGGALVGKKDVAQQQSITFLPSRASDMAGSEPAINVTAKIDRKGISVAADKGRREVSSSQVRP